MRNFILLCSFLLAWPVAGAELQFNFGDLAASGSLTNNFHAELFGIAEHFLELLTQLEVRSAGNAIVRQGHDSAASASETRPLFPWTPEKGPLL